MGRNGARVFILDYSKESLRLVHAGIKDDSISLIRADARQAPFPDQSFDIVFHQGLLEHFRIPYDLLRENHRILKKDGLLLVDVPQTFHFYTIMKKILLCLGLWFAGWERQFTLNSLSRILTECGFVPVHSYGDWSRPGIIYKIIRGVFGKIGINLPMFPHYLGGITASFYRIQGRLRRKRLFLFTVLSIGIIARK
jgi:SAM-dependent methyltransferase